MRRLASIIYGDSRRRRRTAAALALCALAAPGAATASDPQPDPNVAAMAATYAYKDGGNPPAGAAYKFGTAPNVPGDQIPQSAAMPPQPTPGKRYFNPSGLFLAYDSNVFETLYLPYRAAGDQSADDPPGNGGNPLHGFCAPGPPSAPGPEVAAGRCPNHQLEYAAYYEEAMRDILGDFGVTTKRYEFESPGSGNTDAGRSFNLAAIVPGADHPEQSIVVSGHYDQTRDGPASAWDSAEGHAEVIRMAKIMADYWKATGTRPAVTVKFIPWDQEESGLLGSIDYVENNIPPGEEQQVRGYFNVDPCGGGYPAYRRGAPVPGSRVPASVQVADPALFEDKPEIKARFERFNTRSDQIVDEAFGYLDDRLLNTTGQPEIFVSDPEAAAEGKDSDRDETPIGTEGPLLFTSDYANFEAKGIPFFNFGPDFTGPGAQGSPNSPEGLAILHTPNDNLRTINALTSFDQTGSAASEGWAKGQEMCAQTEAWYMLQPEMGGGQTANGDVVAYYEALPNEVVQRQRVRFDAEGSYQYADAGQRTRRSDADLTYEWDFGDGQTGTGKSVQHAYSRIGKYQSKLTVRSAGGQADTMELPVTVIGSDFAGPELNPLPAEDADGSYPLEWQFGGTRAGFTEFAVEESTDLQTLLTEDAEGKPEDRWNVAREPAGEGRLEPWQPSDSAAPKARGNQSRSGRRSFWTGVKPQDFPQSPVNARSVLTLKEPITVPKAGGDVQLGYSSLFQSEGDDQGRVEVAEVGPDPSAPLEWEPVDVLQATNTAAGESDPFIFSPTDPTSLTQELQPRRANLAAFKGQRLLVRFVYQLGDADRAASQPSGWYLDDIRLQAGTWRPIGTTAARAFEVFGKTAGTYGYRVKGVYADGVETAPSNWETIKVARGVSAPGSGSAQACQATTGFGSLSVRPRGRGLDVRVKRRVRRPFTVTVERVASSSRISKARRVAVFRRRSASFRWAGRGALASGYYTVRVSMQVGRRVDVRRFAFSRARGRFKRRSTYSRRDTCRTLGSFKLSRPVFGGRGRNPLRAGFRLFDDAEVSLVVRRGRRTVRTFAAQPRLRGVPYKLDLSALDLPRGDYRVTITVRRGRAVTRATLVARRL